MRWAGKKGSHENDGALAHVDGPVDHKNSVKITDQAHGVDVRVIVVVVVGIICYEFMTRIYI